MVRAKLSIGVICAATLMACSSSDDNNGNGNGGNGGTANGGSSGNASGGTAGISGGSSGEGGSSGSAGTGPCTDPIGSSRRDGVCACRAPKPDTCEVEGSDTCVNMQTDPNHCGNCTTVCDPGAACSGGVCGTAPTEVTTVTGCSGLHLAIDATNLYWVDSGQGTVSSMPLAGGDIVPLATNQAKPTSVVVDANGVYWNNLDDNTVMKSTTPGNPPVTVVPAQADPISGIAVGSDFIFYTQQQNIFKVPTSGGDPIFIAESPTGDKVPVPCSGADAGSPDAGAPASCHPGQGVICGGLPTGLFANDSRIFWTASGRQAVESALITGGPACTDGYLEIGESQGSLLFSVIRASGTNAYWANGEQLKTANIAACEASGSCVANNTSVSATPNFDQITAFAISGDNAYFIAAEGGVFKSPKAPLENGNSNPAAALARDQMQLAIDPSKPETAGSMVADDIYLYWATSDCKIMSLPL